MSVHRYVEVNGLAAMLATKRLAGVAPEVNIRECVTHMPLLSLNKASHSGFETQRRRHQKSKTVLSVARQKRFMSSKSYFKKNRFNCQSVQLDCLSLLNVKHLNFQTFVFSNCLIHQPNYIYLRHIGWFDKTETSSLIRSCSTFLGL